MIGTPPQLAWIVHGSPSVDGCDAHHERCFVCVGTMERGVPVKKWMGSNYTDQNRARCITATHVCEACVWAHSRTSHVLGRPPKEGKKFGGNLRNYSHLYDARCVNDVLIGECETYENEMY